MSFQVMPQDWKGVAERWTQSTLTCTPKMKGPQGFEGSHLVAGPDHYDGQEE